MLNDELVVDIVNGDGPEPLLSALCLRLRGHDRQVIMHRIFQNGQPRLVDSQDLGSAVNEVHRDAPFLRLTITFFIVLYLRVKTTQI